MPGETMFLSWVFPLLVAWERQRRQKQNKEPGDRGKGAQCPFTPSPSFLLFLQPVEDRAECVCLCRLEAHAGCWGHMARACAACSISTTTTRS